ncbi:MAG: ATP-dependent zinc metalloprotease FtsH, partial [Clostridia bacterium]|nr:ATP-dependent zinc metalloprotease FtsH [Clostridia bacterium]
RATEHIKIRFTDVAGAEEEKEELKEIVEFLKNPKKFTDVGAKIPRGVLLVGPPGTGKTLFAKAVAGEANVPFFSISGSDFVEMFVGVGASRVRDMFATAKKNMPCIVFIDEIDAVGRQRGTGLGGGNDEREQTLNQLLVQMDGFETNDGIIIIAATNRADILDPALLRPGRFDRQVYVNLPDVRGREAILRVHARNKPLARDVNFKTLARITTGYSGADLANLLNEAAILAARENSPAITNNHLYEANNKIAMGPKKKSRYVAEKDKKLTAYHEAGHALLAKLMPDFFPVQEVTIIPRGRAGGYTMYRPEDDMPYYNKKFLLSNITTCMGGRIAEEVIFDEISSGAQGDIMQATTMARKMVTEWGMSEEIGLINYGDNDQVFLGRDYQTRTTYSEDTARRIDQEISRIIKERYQVGKDLIKQNLDKLEVMANLLLERETIFQEEVDMIMQGKTLQEILADMDERDKKRAENPFGENKSVAQKVAPKVEEPIVENPTQEEVKPSDTTGSDDSSK